MKAKMLCMILAFFLPAGLAHAGGGMEGAEITGECAATAPLASAEGMSQGFDSTQRVVNDVGDKVSRAVAGGDQALKDALIAAQQAIAKNAAAEAVARENAEAKARIAQEYQVPPRACESLDGAAQEVYGRQAAAFFATYYQSRAANRNMSSPSAGAAALKIFALHEQNYLTAGSLPGADAMAGSILSGAGKPGKVPDYTFSSEQIQAAQDYSNNVTNPLPPGPLTGPAAKTEAGETYEALRLARQAQLSLATLPFSEALARRTPVDGLGQKIRQIWDEMAKNGTSVPQQFLNQLDKNGDKASYGWLRQTEVDRRYASPQWYDDIAQASPAAVAREQAFMTALLISQVQQLVKQNEQMLLLLGGMYSSQIQNGELARQLDAERQVAEQQAAQQ